MSPPLALEVVMTIHATYHPRGRGSNLLWGLLLLDSIDTLNNSCWHQLRFFIWASLQTSYCA